MPATFTIEPQSVPLNWTPEGALRVTGTRIALDEIVWQFNRGCSAETIVARYPSLTLADAYAVIAYYIRNRAQVDAFLADTNREADDLQARIESASAYRELRERLLARQAALNGSR